VAFHNSCKNTLADSVDAIQTSLEINHQPLTLLYRFLNFESSVVQNSNFTLQQSIGSLCTPYTSVTLTATILTQYNGGSVLFCTSSTICSDPQQLVDADAFNSYSATFGVPAGTPITATMIIMFQLVGGVPGGLNFFAGVGSFSISAF